MNTRTSEELPPPSPTITHRLLLKEHIPAPHLPQSLPSRAWDSDPSHPREACLIPRACQVDSPRSSPNLPSSPAGVWPSFPGLTVH